MALGRVRSRAVFAALAHDGARARHGTVRVRYLPPSPHGDGAADPAVAWAIGRTVGPAVVRNRVRRRLRAAAAELTLPPGTYLVGATPAAAAATYATLRADLDAAVARATGRPAAAAAGAR